MLNRLRVRILNCCLAFVLAALPSVAHSSPLFTRFEPGRLDWDILEEIDLRQPLSPDTPPYPAAEPSALGLSDRAEFAQFVDDFFEQKLTESAIPGGSIAVVKDGDVFFSKGYGYADLAAQTPVDAERTLFRVASLSKLFTATATLQLYEQGQLDLADSIAPYLDFPLRNPYDTPINFAHLMTHTDGSTKRRIGLAARTAAKMQPLKDYLPDHLPAIVYPPGELYSYSSHSIALLGYLVEKISGVPFADYIQQNILQPLKMNRTTFLQPPPDGLAENLAVGYQQQKGKFEPVPYLYLNIAPAAALQATAADMAHFMIAHLQAGRYRQAQILQPESVRLMHQTHFRHHPALPGTGYGFRDRYINGRQTIGHLGSLRGYSSVLNLLPEQNIGIFIATNSFNNISGEFLNQFFDRYFPARLTETITQPQIDIEPSKFTGSYRDLEYPRRTMTKVSGLFQLLHVRPYEDNRLQTEAPALLFRTSIEKQFLTPLKPDLFQHADGETLTAFEADDSGAIRYAFNLLFPKIGAYERVPWYETIALHLGVLGFCMFFFATAAASWLIRPLVNQLRNRPRNQPREDSVTTSFTSALTFEDLSWPYRTAGVLGLLNIIFIAGLPLALWLIGGWRLAYGVPLSIVVLLCIPIVTTLLAVMLAVALLFGLVSRDKRGGVIRYVHYWLVAGSVIAFIPFLNYWNLLGFKF